MKILNVIQRYPPAVGGSETWCREVCRQIAAYGHEVKVLTMNINKEEEFWREPPVEDCIIRLGKMDIDGPVVVRRYKRSLPIYLVHHILFNGIMHRLLRIYFYGPHSLEMYIKMREEVCKADIVHLHTVPYPHNWLAFFWARHFKKKVVITPYFHPAHPHYEMWSHYWLMRHCDAVIAMSPYERDYLIQHGVDPDRCYTTGIGLYPDLYHASNSAVQHHRFIQDEETRVVTYIGRKAEYKGIGILIDAIRKVREGINVKLFLAGPNLKWFNTIYSSLSQEDKEYIIDLGTISHQEKVDLLHSSHILVLPSRYESFGIVFLEAWICGIPVIGTKEGAMPSIIGDGGLITEYGNVDDLQKKIILLLTNHELAKGMAENGRRKVLSQYTWKNMGEQVNSIYKEIIER